MRSLGMHAVELVALTGFAIAQPIYQLLADNPTFLIAHHIDGLEVLWYAAVLLLVPPSVLLAFEALVAVAYPPAVRPVHAALAGLFVALTVTPPLARSLSLGPLLWLVLFTAVAAGVGVLRLTQPVTASVLRFAALAVPAFLVLFLTSSGVRELLAPSNAEALAGPTDSDTSVLWVVLDELPLGVLIDEDGEIDSERFPGFASLADVSTWYPDAVASSSRTNVSLLSALTGQHPSDQRVLPVASEHPVNAFSLFGGGREMQVREAITQMCPSALCPAPETSLDDEVLWSDTWTIYVRSVTPDTVADRLVPETDDRWAGFGDSGVDESAAPSAVGTEPVTDGPSAGVDEIQNMDELYDLADEMAGTDQRLLMDTLVDSVPATARPTFTFVHALLPHIPYRYLPGGLAYDRGGSYGSIDGVRWVDDQVPLDHMMQRMALQTQYADEEVGRLVERLRSTGRLDDTVVIVMSDHGVSMTPDTPRREHDPGTLDDMLTIPLFVHYPGRPGGIVDDRPAQPVDLLPTLVDVIGVEVPPSHRFDGDSLLGPADGTAELTLSDGVVPLDPLPDVTAGRVVALKYDLFGPGADFYRPEPHGTLVGTELPSTAAAAPDLEAELTVPERYDEVDRGSGIVPAHVVGTLDGRDEPVDLAVGIGGTVAGVGTTYRVEDGWQIAVMVDPSFFGDGPNDVTVWEIAPDGAHPISIATTG